MPTIRERYEALAQGGAEGFDALEILHKRDNIPEERMRELFEAEGMDVQAAQVPGWISWRKPRPMR